MRGCRRNDPRAEGVCNADALPHRPFDLVCPVGSLWSDHIVVLKPLHHQHTGLIHVWPIYVIAALVAARLWGWV